MMHLLHSSTAKSFYLFHSTQVIVLLQDGIRERLVRLQNLGTCASKETKSGLVP